MKKRKINSIVTMYNKPVLGNLNNKNPVMALSVDKSTLNKKTKLGIAREILKRKGSPDVRGFIDNSKLIIVKSKNLIKWEKDCDLKILGINKVIKDLSDNEMNFIGLEDPDIINNKGIKHIYFTIAFKPINKAGYKFYLGHAKGKKLTKLKATKPVLGPIGSKINGFKEIAYSYSKKNIHLTEMGLSSGNNRPSVIAAVKSKIKGEWEYKGIILHPRKLTYNWCNGYLSPASILPIKTTNKQLILINGREKNKIKNHKKVYGKFRPGLILFNTTTNKVDWISPKPLFEDPNATTITFASDFIQTSKNKGLLYCHINDSFVRAYEINLRELENYVKKNSPQ